MVATPQQDIESPEWFRFFDVFADVFDGGDVSFGINEIWDEGDEAEAEVDFWAPYMARVAKPKKTPQPGRPSGGAFGEDFDLGAWTGSIENGRVPDGALSRVGDSTFLMEGHAAAALGAMLQAANADGVQLSVGETYRDYAGQVAAYNDYKSGTGNLAADPGTSNHGLGLAVDLNITPENHAWLVQNAARFGFSNPFGTGYDALENWHWEYGQGGSAPNYGTEETTWGDVTGKNAPDEFKLVTVPAMNTTTTLPSSLYDDDDGLSSVLSSMFSPTVTKTVKKRRPSKEKP